MLKLLLSIFAQVHKMLLSGESGAPNEKEYEKGLECSFLFSHIVLWPFQGIFV